MAIHVCANVPGFPGFGPQKALEGSFCYALIHTLIVKCAHYIQIHFDPCIVFAYHS